MYLESLKHGFGNLLRFSGRSSRVQFWPYAGSLFAAVFLIWPIVALPVMTRTMVEMERFAREHPEHVTRTVGPGSYSIHIDADAGIAMPPMFDAMALAVLAIAIPFILLIAAAVTRRLHDRNMRGWWGLPPLFLLISGFVLMSRGVRQMIHAATAARDADPFMAILPGFANNVLYLASLGLLALFLSLPGTPGPNRFGDEPA